MDTIFPIALPSRSNRRMRVRQKVHVPAYATLSGASSNDLLALYEVLDIGEAGVALQCALPLTIDQQVNLCLDLAESLEPIYTTARVAWSDAAGHIGFSLPSLSANALRQLKEWLFLNVISAAENAGYDPETSPTYPDATSLPQNFSDILAAASAVQREADSLGSDLESVLFLLASRSRSLLRCTGAAIALEGKDPAFMICRASSGSCAPPIGMSMQLGSGFSGECVRTGKLLRCDDTETDIQVDRQSCRALGIRSMIAAPVRLGNRTVGLLEVFSARPNTFTESDAAVLQRFAETVVAALNRAVRTYFPPANPPAPKPYSAPPGSVLFAHLPPAPETGDSAEANRKSDPGLDSASRHKETAGGVRLPRTHLFLLMAVAATIALALGFILAPWIQERWIQERLHRQASGEDHTVLASSNPPSDGLHAPVSQPAATPSNVQQLRALADHGNATAENALGLLYITGDDKQEIHPDENKAAQMFLKAAQHGSVPAQSKLGSLYWSGRGLPKDDSQAYFWTVLARANGDDASKVLAPFIAMRLTPPQRTAIEQKAEQWLQTRESAKNSPR